MKIITHIASKLKDLNNKLAILQKQNSIMYESPSIGVDLTFQKIS